MMLDGIAIYCPKSGEDCSIRLWDLVAEDDSGDLLLGGHNEAAPR